jgi:adenylate cyclase
MSGTRTSDAIEQPRDRRRLVAVVYADMVGYSRLIEMDAAGTFARLQEQRRELFDPAVARHGGNLVNMAGNSLLITFDSIISAMRFAVEMQRGVPAFDGDHSPDRRIRFRVGVNIGDVIPDGTSMHGDGVNIAARLQAICPPGAICVSRVVRDQVGAQLGMSFKELGAIDLKNIRAPVEAFVIDPSDPSAGISGPSAKNAATRLGQLPLLLVLGVLAIVAIGVFGWRLPLSKIATLMPRVSPATQQPTPLSVVVLPLTNLSNDADGEYLADAITDDLTTDLSQISGSLVIAHSTAESFKGKPIDVRQIGRELGVRYALEGSVRKLADQIEVNAQLIDAQSGGHVWAERFETDRANLAQAQSEITGRLARTLHLELVADASSRMVQHQANPGLQDLLMRGWALWYQPMSTATRQQALQLFERALALDPASVEARVGIATILVTNVSAGLSHNGAEDSRRAEQMVLEAIQRDPNNSSAHQVLGIVRRNQNRLEEAVAEFETSVQLDRNNAHSLLLLGQTTMFLGRPAEAIPYIESSQRLNPRDPNSAFIAWSLGVCYLLLGDVERATTLLRKAVTDNPRLYFFQLYLAGAVGLQGNIDEAKTVLARAIRLQPKVTSLAQWRAAQPYTGNPQFWALREKTLNIGLRRAGMPDD